MKKIIPYLASIVGIALFMPTVSFASDSVCDAVSDFCILFNNQSNYGLQVVPGGTEAFSFPEATQNLAGYYIPPKSSVIQPISDTQPLNVTGGNNLETNFPMVLSFFSIKLNTSDFPLVCTMNWIGGAGITNNSKYYPPNCASAIGDANDQKLLTVTINPRD